MGPPVEARRRSSSVSCFSWLRTLNPFSRRTTSPPNEETLSMLQISNVSSQFGLSDAGPRSYTQKELVKATQNFSDHHLIGKGGYGNVYKAAFSCGTVAAVKVINIKVPLHPYRDVIRAVFSCGTIAAVKAINNMATLQQRSFAAELATLGNLRHQNLINLQGWCYTEKRLFLVYDYMANKSLDTHLFLFNEDEDGDRGGCILSWSLRCSITRDIAKGLDYLHNSGMVVHRDIKAANMLLDSDFRVRISDFGLARHIVNSCNNSNNVHPGYSSIFNDVTLGDGSPGYTAPECIGARAQPTPMSDVFSFGVVVFEILSARKADFSSGLYLVDWMRTVTSWDSLRDALDPKLRNSGDADQKREILGLFNLGLLCTQLEAGHRPTMYKVCSLLNDLPSIAPPKRQGSSYCYRDIVNNSMLDVRTLPSSFLEEEERQLNLQHYSSLVKVPREFPWTHIDVATRQFSTRISHGPYSETYHGEAFGQQLAVKVSKDHDLGKKRLKTELKSVGNVRHVNILTPIGWSSDSATGRCALVYDYMANGSLQDCLGKEEQVLAWNLRYRIAKELGAALFHLHENCNSTAAVQNVKAGNVLLDSEFHVRLALDPGLSINNDAEMSRIGAGTSGCLDPEYVRRTSDTTEYADVFAYGAVLVQLVTGSEQAYDPWDECARCERTRAWHEWARAKCVCNSLGERMMRAKHAAHDPSGEWLRIQDITNHQNDSSGEWVRAIKAVPVDIKLKEAYDPHQVDGLFYLSLLCSNPVREDRPSMKRVLHILRSEIPSHSFLPTL